MSDEVKPDFSLPRVRELCARYYHLVEKKARGVESKSKRGVAWNYDHIYDYYSDVFLSFVHAWVETNTSDVRFEEQLQGRFDERAIEDKRKKRLKTRSRSLLGEELHENATYPQPDEHALLRMEDLLSTLPNPKEREAVRMRLGLPPYDHNGIGCEEIAKALGLNEEYKAGRKKAERMVKNALVKLRETCEQFDPKGEGDSEEIV